MNSNQVMKPSTRILLFLFCSITLTASKLLNFSSQVVTFAGKDVRLNCSTDTSGIHWTYRAVGALKSSDVYRSRFGLRNGYLTSERHSVDINLTTGHHDLVILGVQLSDAGTYTCIDNNGQGESIAVELTVMDTSPICSSNISSEGALSDNSCNLEPDYIGFFCSVRFQGNVDPMLQWKNANTGDVITTGVRQNNESISIITSTIVQKAEMNINKANYSCEIRDSPPSRVSRCFPQEFKVAYLYDTFRAMSVSESIGNVTCSANTSLPCKYTWIGDDLQIKGAVLDLNDPKITHKDVFCLAECSFRGRVCSMKPMLIHWNEKIYENPIMNFWWILLTTNGVTIVAAIVIVKRRRIKEWLSETFSKIQNYRNKTKQNDEEQIPLLTVVTTNSKKKKVPTATLR